MKWRLPNSLTGNSKVHQSNDLPKSERERRVGFSAIFYLIGFVVSEWLIIGKFSSLIGQKGGASAWGWEYFAAIIPLGLGAILFPVLAGVFCFVLHYFLKIQQGLVLHFVCALATSMVTPFFVVVGMLLF